jgi:hypothetical protein
MLVRGLKVGVKKSWNSLARPPVFERTEVSYESETEGKTSDSPNSVRKCICLYEPYVTQYFRWKELSLLAIIIIIKYIKYEIKTHGN